MWEKRDFVAALPLEELKAAHQATLLGNVWHLGNPLLSVAVYYIVFGKLLNSSRGIDNFILFLVVGVFAYRLTSNCISDGARSISSNAGLMRSFRFPRAILPVSSVVRHFYTFSFELMVIAVVALVTGEGVQQRWLVLPLLLILHAVIALGGSLIAARLNDTFRDVQQVIPFVLRLGMYASGVMFDIREKVVDAPGWIRAIVRWNPMVSLVELYRYVFLGGPVDGAAAARLVAVSIGMLLIGFRYFVAAESRYGRG